MKKDIKIGVVGGDTRQIVCASELAKAGYDIACFGTSKKEGIGAQLKYCHCLDKCVSGKNAILLGVPYSRDGKWINCPPDDFAISVKALFDKFVPGQLILGGKFNADVYKRAEKSEVKPIDYLNSEELCILNAVLTAEGAIAIAMAELDIAIVESKPLILGFGRCAKALAKDLKGLGAEPVCAARKKSDLAYMEVMGYGACNINSFTEYAVASDIIFNTVPELVITKDVIDALPKSTLIIDLASAPGGVDSEAAKEKGCRVIKALSLPGKVAPLSAGKIIARTVDGILQKELL